LGNKNDLKHRSSVFRDIAHKFAEEIGSSFYEVSALNGENVELAIQTLIEKIHLTQDPHFRSLLETFVWNTLLHKIKIQDLSKIIMDYLNFDLIYSLKDVELLSSVPPSNTYCQVL